MSAFRSVRLGLVLYVYWSFFGCVAIGELFGMSGRPRCRPLGVSPGPGTEVRRGVRGAPEPYTNIHLYSHPDVRLQPGKFSGSEIWVPGVKCQLIILDFNIPIGLPFKVCPLSAGPSSGPVPVAALSSLRSLRAFLARQHLRAAACCGGLP